MHFSMSQTFFQAAEPSNLLAGTIFSAIFRSCSFCIFSKKVIKTVDKNCGPEKSSKNDVPGICFGTQNRQEFMFLRPKIEKIAQKSICLGNDF